MLSKWKTITKDDVKYIKNKNKELQTVEYFNSIIYQIYSRMIYKVIDNSLVICKPISIMGKYNIIQYCNLNIPDDINQKLLNNGITLRGHHIKGTKDKFGEEYVYDTRDYVEMIGSKFSTFRKAVSKYKKSINIKSGFHKDIDKILKLYPNHQTKLYKLIVEYPELVNVTRVYIDDDILGFSIVENINKQNGIIIQELFNKDMGVRYASYIIHYCNCINNESKFLNAGGSRNKNIKFAKNKLRPCKLLRIGRETSKIKLERDDWFFLKNNKIDSF